MQNAGFQNLVICLIDDIYFFKQSAVSFGDLIFTFLPGQIQYMNIRFGHLSRDMRFPTKWYVRPAKAQTSLRIRAV